VSEGDGDITYERGENHLFFQVGDRMLISRMIDGQFSGVRACHPEGNDKHIEFERDRLTNAVKRVALPLERALARRQDSHRQGQGRRDVEQPGTRRGKGNAAGGVRPATPCQICFNAAIRARFSGAVSTDIVVAGV